MVTNDGQDMDPAFNSHLFVILLKLIDINLKPPISSVLNFIQGIFQNHPQTFNET